jgi:hypothetical protein
VLKPERGYSGKGVRVGGVHGDARGAIDLAIKEGDYILQEKIPLRLWGEVLPEPDPESGRMELKTYQTDFRSLFGPEGLFGFLGRYGGVPTNVGSGGGVQPLGVLRSEMSVYDAVMRINQAILGMDYGDVLRVVDQQNRMALDHKFTYVLGPIKIALRPRIVTPAQLDALEGYCKALWADCLVLEQMWLSGELDDYVQMDEDELEIARSQPWKGGPAIIASDGLFDFGAKGNGA